MAPKRRILATSGTAGTMPDKDYWIARAVERTEHFEDIAQGGVKEIIGKYETAQDMLRKNLTNWLAKYGVKDGDQLKIAFNEAIKPLPAKDAKAVSSRAKSALKSAGDNKPYAKSLQYLSRQIKIPAIAELNLENEIALHDLALYEVKNLQGILTESMKGSFVWTINDFEKILDGDFGEISKKHIKEAIYKPWYEENFSDRIWSNRSNLVKKLNQGLLRNIAGGEKAQSIVKWLKKEMKTATYKAERIVRTESKNAVEQGTKDAYKEAGVKQYEYVAILDGKTSDVCLGLDGKVFDLKDAKVGVNMPPLHPNCRSTTIAVI